MSENEIPLGSNRAVIPEYFYRVTIIGFRFDSDSERFQPVLREEDFKSSDLLEAKQNALSYFTDAVSAFMLEGKYMLPYKGEIDWSRCIPDGHKFCLSLIKCEKEDVEEDFCLIGGTEDEMTDARMEEEIAVVLLRKSGKF